MGGGVWTYTVFVKCGTMMKQIFRVFTLYIFVTEQNKNKDLFTFTSFCDKIAKSF